jgi:hypothetical protein
MSSGKSYVLPPPSGGGWVGGVNGLDRSSRNELARVDKPGGRVGKNIGSVTETFANALGTFPLPSPHLPPPARGGEDDQGEQNR